jgi:hypothetical protein
VRVLRLDGAYVLGWGEKRPVLVAVDLGERQPVAVVYVDEHDPQAVQRWLEPMVQRLRVSVIVTDDLMMYKMVAQKLNLEHQICQPVLVLFQGSMSGTGWEEHSRNCKIPSPRMAVGAGGDQGTDCRVAPGWQ